VYGQAGLDYTNCSAFSVANMSQQDLPFISDIVAIRRDLHAHPELSFKEHRTADLVARELSGCGIEIHRGLAGTGVVGVLRKGSSARAIGLRADMDALPVVEKNDFAHRSTHAGCMHACGHDGHTAMLLGAARYLSLHRDAIDFDGTVYFIFQPAEESEGGALVMVKEGLFDQFPMDAVFGLHNWPGIPVGEMAVMPGPVMAGTCCFEITVRGKGCHAGMPHQGIDAVVAASHLVLALQTIVSRETHPCDPAVVSVTQIHGGEAFNVIPDEVLLRGTIRSFRPEIQQRIERSMATLCSGIGQTFGATLSLRFDQRYPPTINHRDEAALCQRVAARVVGEEKVRTTELPSMGAEDFAYMLREKPGCYVWLGNGADGDGGAGACTLHNPHYDFNDDILPIGIRYWVALVEDFLKPVTV